MTRLIWADRLKGILILAVVMSHAIQLALKDAWIDNHLCNYLCSFHMATFMAISGFLSYRRVVQSRFALVFRRFQQLVVPFLIWSIIKILLSKTVTFVSFVRIFIYPDGSFWFLWVLFFINVVFWAGDWMAEKIKVRQEVIIVFISLILVSLMVLFEIRILGFQFIAFYFIFFIFGYYLNKYQHIFPFKKWLLITLSVIWAIMGWFWKMHELPSFLMRIPLPQSIMLYGYRVLTGLIAVYVLIGSGPLLLNKNSVTPLVNLGRVSLGIYVVHIIIMPWIVGLLHNHISYSFAVIVISFIIALLGSWLCVVLLGKWRITNRFLLGKI